MSVWDEVSENRYLDLRSLRLVNFVMRHPRWTMPILFLLVRLKYSRVTRAFYSGRLGS